MPHAIVITVICDGNRPDFVRDDTTPVMARLKRAGTWFAEHRGIFPSATRPSSAAIATGSLPIHHGLRGNSVGLPIPGGHEFHDAGKPEFYDTYRAHFGRMLTRPALAERVANHGGAILASNGSPGQTFFHDASGHAHTFHRVLCYGPGRVPTGETLVSATGVDGDRAVTDRFLAALMAMRPATATLWLSEPDHSMHAAPLGSPEHLAALAHADAQVGRVAEAADRLRDDGHDVLLLVGSDHGQESITEVMPLERRLFEAGFKDDLEGPEIIVAPQGSAAFIHLGGRALAAKHDIVGWLKAQPQIGAVFVDDDLPVLGQIPGDDVIAVDMAKTDGGNVNGVPGLTAMASRFSEDPEGRKRHCGMHGGRGAYETRPVLIAVGRGFAAGAVHRAATSITDLTPTALAHLRLPLADLDGRALQV